MENLSIFCCFTEQHLPFHWRKWEASILIALEIFSLYTKANPSAPKGPEYLQMLSVETSGILVTKCTSVWKKQLFMGDGEVPQVPKYPEYQAEENDQRSREDKEIPER